MIRRCAQLLLYLVVFLATASCTLTITPPAEINPNGVIFSPEQAEASLDAVGGAVEGAWSPTDADVAELEAALPAFLKSAENPWLREDPPIWERVPDYMRQYLGIVEDGEQLIYANFFCTVNDIDWHDEYVFVMDGGDCFFQVKYNPATGEFSDLAVNGEG